MSELLEWREHDRNSEITYTEFGPYMVEKLAENDFRSWHPDITKNARVMIEGFSSRKSARASCQYDVDGRRNATEGK